MLNPPGEVIQKCRYVEIFLALLSAYFTRLCVIENWVSGKLSHAFPRLCTCLRSTFRNTSTHRATWIHHRRTCRWGLPGVAASSQINSRGYIYVADRILIPVQRQKAQDPRLNGCLMVNLQEQNLAFVLPARQ